MAAQGRLYVHGTGSMREWHFRAAIARFTPTIPPPARSNAKRLKSISTDDEPSKGCLERIYDVYSLDDEKRPGSPVEREIARLARKWSGWKARNSGQRLGIFRHRATFRLASVPHAQETASPYDMPVGATVRAKFRPEVSAGPLDNYACPKLQPLEVQNACALAQTAAPVHKRRSSWQPVCRHPSAGFPMISAMIFLEPAEERLDPQSADFCGSGEPERESVGDGFGTGIGGSNLPPQPFRKNSLFQHIADALPHAMRHSLSQIGTWRRMRLPAAKVCMLGAGIIDGPC